MLESDSSYLINCVQSCGNITYGKVANKSIWNCCLVMLMIVINRVVPLFDEFVFLVPPIVEGSKKDALGNVRIILLQVCHFGGLRITAYGYIGRYHGPITAVPCHEEIDYHSL